MNILLIEDHPIKQAQIVREIISLNKSHNVIIRNSYNSGLKEIVLNHPDYDLLLLDISMPNYDISSEEGGGDWLPFAGKKILNNLFLRDIPLKCVVITMHGNFEDGTRIKDLDSELRQEFHSNYQGYVYYSQTTDEWKNQLKDLIIKSDL